MNLSRMLKITLGAGSLAVLALLGAALALLSPDEPGGATEVQRVRSGVTERGEITTVTSASGQVRRVVKWRTRDGRTEYTTLVDTFVRPGQTFFAAGETIFGPGETVTLPGGQVTVLERGETIRLTETDVQVVTQPVTETQTQTLHETVTEVRTETVRDTVTVVETVVDTVTEVITETVTVEIPVTTTVP